MLDFGALPPELNSARMYAGPGSGPMLVAADAWQQMTGELSTAAASFGSTVTDLTSGSWAGPASMSMAAAVSPYLGWLNATAAQAGQAGSQAAAAAAAFEAAFAATVPPPLIAANRSLLASLVATNVLGQNTPAIAATEAHYGEMWAQDAAAMYGYAAASSAATKVTPFTPPPQTTQQAGLAAQAAAAQQPGTDLQSVITSMPQALQGLASPQGLDSLASSGTSGSGAASGSGLSSLSSLSSLTMPARMAMMPMSMLMRMFMMGGANGASKAATGLAATTAGAGAASSVLTGGVGALGSAGLTGAAGASPAAAAASMGGATSIGALSVPTAWTGVGPAISPAAAVLSGTTASAASPAGAGAAAMPPMMPITNMGGRGGFGGSATHYDFRPTVLARSPIGG